jgi:hypothetical protein
MERPSSCGRSGKNNEFSYAHLTSAVGSVKIPSSVDSLVSDTFQLRGMVHANAVFSVPGFLLFALNAYVKRLNRIL